MPGYTLLDGVERNAEYDTFEIPDEFDRRNANPGDFVKLCFLSDEGGERMWVEVKYRVADGRYIGTLANHPVTVPGLSYDDEVEFGPEHIISTA